MKNKIALEGVVKAYDKNTPVIENLDLEIEEGSFTILLGPSGCGKSTTLRLIAGLEEETSGKLFISGKDMKNVKPGDREIAMVFQNYALYPTMSVKDNIEFGLKNSKVPKQEREERINKVSEVVGLSEFLKRKPNALSGGQRQRVALARAMVKNPEVFLMDEPLSNLDAKLRSQLRTDLIELHKKLRTTFVYVTHDQVEAMSMGMQIVLMNKGKIMQKGTPYEIYHNPDNVFTAQFIGTPPMNIIKAEQLHTMPDNCNNVSFVGFRPENVLFEKEGRRDGVYIDGNILTREMLGAETLYKINSEIGTIQVKHFEVDRQLEEKVKMFIPFSKLYFFDDREQRIR